MEKKPLTFWEKHELSSAKHRYQSCVDRLASAKQLRPTEIHMCEAAEKKAFAELLRVQAQYAGRE